MVKSAGLCALSLGLLLLWSPWVNAQQILSPSPQSQPQGVQTVLDDLAQTNVVYLGETHDSAADHQAQLQIIQDLHQQNPRIAIAMEMFQRPYQAVLNQYLAGEITEAELRQRSQYDQRWGFPWVNYAPILRFAKENQLPVLALNTPSEVTRRVAQKGLDSLSESDRQWIPPLSEICTDNDAYRRFMRSLYNDFHLDYGSSENFENFFLAQVLWDETMAESVAAFLTIHPDYQVIVLTGQGHIVYGYGIPSRVARRLERVNLVQRSILLNPSAEIQTEGRGAIADYFWFTH